MGQLPMHLRNFLALFQLLISLLFFGLHFFTILHRKLKKVVAGKRVTLLAESTSASVYMRQKLTPLPEPTALAHALIVSP